jgi:hypothetical protein
MCQRSLFNKNLPQYKQDSEIILVWMTLLLMLQGAGMLQGASGAGPATGA